MIVVASLSAALASLLIGYALGMADANRRWASLGDPPRRCEFKGRTYWVCDAESVEATAALLDALELDRDERESRERVARLWRKS